MLSDRFFEEYAKTGAPKPAADDQPEIPEKDSYSRAEVDEIVNAKVAEAISEIRSEMAAFQQPDNKPEDNPAE